MDIGYRNVPFEHVKKGDRVYSLVHGWGIISNIFEEDELFEVEFKHVFKNYYINGKGGRHENRTLFWYEPEIIDQKYKDTFDLEKEYRKLEIKHFSLSANFILFKGNFWTYVEESANIPNVTYFTEKGLEEFVDKLNANNVTIEDLENVMSRVKQEKENQKILDE